MKHQLTNLLFAALIFPVFLAPALAAGKVSRGSYSIGTQLSNANSGTQTQIAQEQHIELNSEKRQPVYSERRNAQSADRFANMQALARPQSHTSHHSGDYSIYEANITLIEDDDLDGFFHRFIVEFDADTTYFSAEVYAKLYLSYEGGPFYHYYTTDDFIIDGSAGDDEYEVTTSLTSGYPTGYYDIAIDLYESDSGLLVASLDAFDEPELHALPLEDGQLDGSQTHSLFAAIDLISDQDADGFYHYFSIVIDAESPHGSNAYARIYSRLNNGPWLHEYTTSIFTVLNNTSSDALTIDTDWESGYPTGYYDFRIDLFDQTNTLLTSVDSGSPFLADVPLEDSLADTYYSPVPTPPSNSGHSHSDEHGGGSIYWLIWFLVLAGIIRQYSQRTSATRV